MEKKVLRSDEYTLYYLAPDFVYVDKKKLPVERWIVFKQRKPIAYVFFSRGNTIKYIGISKLDKTKILVMKLKNPFPKKDLPLALKKYKSALKTIVKEDATPSVDVNVSGNKAKWFLIILNVVSLLVPFIAFILVVAHVISVKRAEWYAEKVEKEISKELYKGQTKNFPPLDEYSHVIEAIETLLKSKNLNCVLIYGPPGTGKSYIVRRTLYFNNVKYGLFKGATLGLKDLVSTLYRYRKGYVLVFDDFDSATKDEDAMNILKAALDSYPKRIITIPQAVKAKSSEIAIKDLPERFVFESKIIIITNKEKNQLDKALLSRSYPVEVKFTSRAILKIIEKVMKFIAPTVPLKVKYEVLETLKKLQRKCKKLRIDFRTFGAAVDMRSTLGPGKWIQVFKEIYC